MRLPGYALIPGLVLALAACSGVERRPPAAPVEEPTVRQLPPPALPPAEPAPGEPWGPAGAGPHPAPAGEAWPAPAPESAPKSSGAVVALLDEAQNARQRGDLNRSAATLERALRIEPRNPWLWNRLAHLRLEQGRLGEAGDLAAKSNALAGGDSKLKRDNWRLIAEARRSAGDLTGARAAEHKANSIR